MSRGYDVGAGRSRNDPRKSRGRAGEELACLFLEHHGYSIVETNHRSRYGEIDIIARKETTLAFVEVKTRLGRSFGEPFEAVGPRKQNQIRRMASMWVAANQGDPELRQCEFRFDVISVYLSGREPDAGAPAEGKCVAGIEKPKLDIRTDVSVDAVPEKAGMPGILHIKDAFR
ncbi:MAG: YraN family protein [Thermoleophilia bacterium]